MKKEEQIIAIFQENEGAKCIVKMNNGDDFKNVVIGRLSFSPTKYVIGIGLLDSLGKELVVPISQINGVDLII